MPTSMNNQELEDFTYTIVRLAADIAEIIDRGARRPHETVTTIAWVADRFTYAKRTYDRFERVLDRLSSPTIRSLLNKAEDRFERGVVAGSSTEQGRAHLKVALESMEWAQARCREAQKLTREKDPLWDEEAP